MSFFLPKFLIETILILFNKMIFLVKSNYCSNTINCFSCVLKYRDEKQQEDYFIFRLTAPPFSAHESLPTFFSFVFFGLLIRFPCRIPEKTINGTNSKMTRVNFHPVIKAMVNEHITAPTALKMIPTRTPDRP